MNKNNPAENMNSAHTVVACLGGDRTALEQRPAPRPDAGEILLALRVVGFCGTDLYKLDTGTAAPGSVLGHELVGDVIALGGGVDKFSIGDRVAVPHHVSCGECVYCRRGNETMCEVFRENLLVPGGFADTIVVRARAVEQAAKRLPEDLSDKAAVFMEPAGCVLRGIRRAGLEGTPTAPPSAVVMGAGSMGLLHLLVLNAVFPDANVTVIDPVGERRAMAEKLGAALTSEPGEAALEAVMASTGGDGVDIVAECVGGHAVSGILDDSIACLKVGGRLLVVGYAYGQSLKIDSAALIYGQWSLIGTRASTIQDDVEVARLVESGQLKPVLSQRFPLEQANEALEQLSKSSPIGRMVLTS